MFARLFERWMATRLEAFRLELAQLLEHAARQVPLSRLERFEHELAELSDLHNQLLDSHKRLRARIGMREAREKQPEAPLDIEEQRRALELKHGLRR